MSEIVRLFPEITDDSLIAWVRERRCVSTGEVAGRFGFYPKDALKRLKELERAGRIVSKRVRLDFIGAGLEWKVRQ